MYLKSYIWWVYNIQWIIWMQHHDQRGMPKNYRRVLSFSSVRLYFFSFGTSICMTLILLTYSIFTDLLELNALFSPTANRFYLSVLTSTLWWGTFGMAGCALLTEVDWIDLSSSFQLFFFVLLLLGEGLATLPLLVFIFLSWLIDLLLFSISFPAVIFCLLIKSW